MDFSGAWGWCAWKFCQIIWQMFAEEMKKMPNGKMANSRSFPQPLRPISVCVCLIDGNILGSQLSGTQ